MNQKNKFKQTEIGKVPEDWEVKKLKDLCIRITDGSHSSPKTAESGKYIATVRDMTDYGFNFSTCRLISEEDFNNLAKQDCKPLKNDVLIAKDGSYLKHTFVSSGEDEVVILSSIAILRPDQKKILPYFLRYLFVDTGTKERISANYVSGAVIPRIVLRDFEKIDLPLPPMTEQRSIAKILSDLDAKIELNNQMNKTLEAIGQALFKKWFVDNPEKNKWKEGKLGEIMENYDSKRVPLSSLERSKKKGKVPYYGATGIFDYVDDFIFDGDYVLMGEDGSVINEDGTPVLQYVRGKFWANNHAHVLKAKNPFYNEFLYLLLTTMNVSAIVTGAVQPKINQQNMNNLGIAFPPRELLEQMRTPLEKILLMIYNNNIQSQKLSQIRDALLPKLMSGEIRVK